jgi:hypothetical protein
MFHTFRSVVFETWDAWNGMFSELPYGDPYISSAALFFVVAMTCKLVSEGKI